MNADNGSPFWYTAEGYGEASLAAIDDAVYVRSYNGSLFALRASNGSPIWQYSAGYAGLSAPTVSNGMIYLNSISNLGIPNVQALKTSDGSVLWQTEMHIISSPVVVDGTLYAGGGGDDQFNVYALRAENGALLWHWHTFSPQGNIGGPIVVDNVVCTSIGAASGLYALQAHDGRLLWHSLRGENITAPVGGRVVNF